MAKLELLNINNVLPDLARAYTVDPNKEIPEDILGVAAIIVRAEFQQKGDWYNAMVESIAQYLRTIPANKGLYNVAEGLADRIIGIEPEERKE